MKKLNNWLLLGVMICGTTQAAHASDYCEIGYDGGAQKCRDLVLTSYSGMRDSAEHLYYYQIKNMNPRLLKDVHLPRLRAGLGRMAENHLTIPSEMIFSYIDATDGETDKIIKKLSDTLVSLNYMDQGKKDNLAVLASGAGHIVKHNNEINARIEALNELRAYLAKRKEKITVYKSSFFEKGIKYDVFTTIFRDGRKTSETTRAIIPGGVSQTQAP